MGASDEQQVESKLGGAPTSDLKELNLDGEKKKNVIKEIFRQDSDSIIDGEEVKKIRNNERKFIKAF